MFSSPPEHAPAPGAVLILAGQQSLTEYVRFVKAEAIDGHRRDEHTLVREWQETRRSLQELATTTDPESLVPRLSAIHDGLSGRAEAALDDPIAKRCFGLVPRRWMMVELPQMIVWQRHVVTSECDVERREHARIEDLFQIATAESQPLPAIHTRVKNGNQFSFTSLSSDLRVLATTPLPLRAVEDCQIYGRAAAVVGVVIGYSVNFVVAAHIANRLVLLNGTHRAYRLLRQGITRMPCLVVTLSDFDETALVGFGGAAAEVEELVTRARPPLLKDFLDTRLAKRIEVPRLTRLLELELEFRESTFASA